MDPSIWSRLPDELLERVLSLLPLRTIVALRPTCKRFNSLLNTPSFLSIFKFGRPPSSTSSTAFLILSHPQFSNRSLPFYDCSADTWRAVPLLASSLVSSSNGLLLFSLGPTSLLVSNPLTNSSAVLACPTQLPHSSATLVSPPSPSPHGYSVFLPCPVSNSVFLYNSTSLSWSRFPGGPPSLKHGTPFCGRIYFVTPEPFSVVAFDLRTGSWDRRAVPDLPDELAFIRLVSGNERLFLIGGIGRDGISRSVAVWEMTAGEEGWAEVGRVPELMCRKFVSVCYHNYAHVYCVWQEGTVCLCCTTWPEVLFLRVGRGTWHWLPRCPLLPEKWSCGFRWFSFAPDLYALV